MNNKLSYNGEFYTVIKCINIEKTEIAICINDSNTNIIYLKVNYIGDRASYVALKNLIKVLPDYQNIASTNKDKILNCFIISLNKLLHSYKNFNINYIIEIINLFEDYIFKNEIYYYTTKRIDTEIPDDVLNKLSKYIEKIANEKKSISNSKNIFYKTFKNLKILLRKILYNKYCGAYSVMVIVSAVGLMICVNEYNNWKTSGNQVKNIMDDIFNETEISFIDDEQQKIDDAIANQGDSADNPVTESELNQKYGADYWTYKHQSFINVDFNGLLARNPDTVAWLYVNNTNINYPVVQSKDNEFYLNRSFNGSNNIAGWIFADYRADMKNFGRNSVIYGHGRTDQVMFGSLESTLQPEWYTNESNQYIRLSTPTKNTVWQIFSMYTIKAESYYLTHNFESDESFRAYLNTILGRSIYDFGVDVDIYDKVLTLSTCLDYNGNRIVVHSKLVREESR